MLLIFIGILNISHRKNNSLGVILIAVGTFFLLPKIFDFPFDTGRLFLPIILVTIGVVILFHKRRAHNHWHNFTDCCDNDRWHHQRQHGNEGFWDNKGTEGENQSSQGNAANSKGPASDFLDEVNVFGGSERKIYSKSFRGGEITSIFGGSTYDMLDCELADGKNVLECVNIFGGSKLIIPSHWKVHLEVVSIFGGFADKRRSAPIAFDEKNKELFITGVAIFGGGEIKSI